MAAEESWSGAADADELSAVHRLQPRRVPRGDEPSRHVLSRARRTAAGGRLVHCRRSRLSRYRRLDFRRVLERTLARRITDSVMGGAGELDPRHRRMAPETLSKRSVRLRRAELR